MGELKNKLEMDLVLTYENEGENIFLGNAVVKGLRKELELAEQAHITMKKEQILEAFRACVAQFVEQAKRKPRVALLTYYDRNYLNEAYEQEYRKLFDQSCPTYMTVDSIKLCGACSNQEEGTVRFQISEVIGHD